MSVIRLSFISALSLIGTVIPTPISHSLNRRDTSPVIAAFGQVQGAMTNLDWAFENLKSYGTAREADQQITMLL
jgi:hypothetical protein